MPKATGVLMQVSGGDYAPVAGQYVQLRNLSNPSAYTSVSVTPTNGAWSVAGVPAGAYEIYYSTSTSGPWTDTGIQFDQAGTPAWENVVDYGADPNGVGDSTIAINNAIQVRAAGQVGGTVYFPPGIYKISGSIVINGHHVRLLGAGIGSSTNARRATPPAAGDGASIIQPVTGANFDVIQTPLPPTVGMAGYIYYGIEIENLTIDCQYMTGTTPGIGNGIHLYGTRYATLKSVRVYSCPNWAFLCEGDSTNYGYNSSLYDCLANTGCAGGAWFTAHEQSCMQRCLFEGAAKATAAPQPYAAQTRTKSAYELLADTGWIMATNCTFGNGGTFTGPAVMTTNNEPFTLIGSLFDTVPGTALYLNGGNHTIIGNILSSPVMTTAGPAIQIGSSGNYIAGNQITKLPGNVATYMIQEAGGPFTGNRIIGNQFFAGTSGVISQNATSTNIIANNSGYNPVGNIASPAVPASGAAYANNFGVDASVYVSPRESSCAVSIGGRATGIRLAPNGSGQEFRVPAGQTITLTYSSAPSWTWFGD